jgi:hypothetical protein
MAFLVWRILSGEKAKGQASRPAGQQGRYGPSTYPYPSIVAVPG